MISIPALLSTGAWAAVTIGLIIAFGRTEGGAWSIVGGVARGVRDWSRERRTAPRRSSSPFLGELPPMQIPAGGAPLPAVRSPERPTATLEEREDRPLP